MAAAVYQGQLKFEVLREAFRKERLSAGATSAAERVTSARGLPVTAEDMEAPKRCIQASSNQRSECTMGEFLASFGVVRQDDDVSSSTTAAGPEQEDREGDVSGGREETSQGAGEHGVMWACQGRATAKRKRVRGTFFRQLSKEETVAWLQRAEAETKAQHGSGLEEECGNRVSGDDSERHGEGSLGSCLGEVFGHPFVPLPPLLENSIEGAECRQGPGEDEVKAEPEGNSLAWEPEEILDDELTLGEENLFDEMEAIGGRGYDRPLLMKGLRAARVPKKDRHVEGIPVARRKRNEKHEWWY